MHSFILFANINSSWAGNLFTIEAKLKHFATTLVTVTIVDLHLSGKTRKAFEISYLHGVGSHFNHR